MVKGQVSTGSTPSSLIYKTIPILTESYPNIPTDLMFSTPRNKTSKSCLLPSFMYAAYLEYIDKYNIVGSASLLERIFC